LLKVTLILALTSLPPDSLNAGFELTGWYSSNWTQGRLNNYGHGQLGSGCTARLSWELGGKSWAERSLITEFSYIDLGVEKDFIPAGASQTPLDVATDFYLMMFKSGISLGKRTGHLRPYCDLLGGLTYYSAWSQIGSRYQTNTPIYILSKYGGTTWYAGIGVGIKILFWSRELSTAKSRLDEFFINARAEFNKGGEVEFLDCRSVRDQAGTVSFDNHRANLDLLQLNFGVSFAF